MVAYVTTLKSVTVSDVLREGLGIDKARWTQVEQNRVARILKTIGWWRKQVREGRSREWRYFPLDSGDE